MTSLPRPQRLSALRHEPDKKPTASKALIAPHGTRTVPEPTPEPQPPRQPSQLSAQKALKSQLEQQQQQFETLSQLRHRYRQLLWQTMHMWQRMDPTTMCLSHLRWPLFEEAQREDVHVEEQAQTPSQEVYTIVRRPPPGTRVSLVNCLVYLGKVLTAGTLTTALVTYIANQISSRLTQGEQNSLKSFFCGLFACSGQQAVVPPTAVEPGAKSEITKPQEVTEEQCRTNLAVAFTNLGNAERENERLRREVDTLNTNVSSLTSAYQKIEADKTKLFEKLQTSEGKVEAFKALDDERKRLLGISEAKVQELETKNGQLSATNLDLSQKLNTMELRHGEQRLAARIQETKEQTEIQRKVVEDATTKVQQFYAKQLEDATATWKKHLSDQEANFKQTLDQSTKKCNDVVATLQKTKDDYIALQTSDDLLKSRHAELDRKLASCEAEKRDQTNRYETQTKDLKETHSKFIEELKKQIVSLNLQLKDTARDLEVKQNQLAELETARLRGATEEIQERLITTAQLKQQHAEELAGLRDQLTTQMTQNVALETRLNSMTQELNQKKTTFAQLEQQLHTAQESEKRYIRDLVSTASALQIAEGTLESRGRDLADKTTRLEELETTLRDAQRKSTEWESQFQDCQKRRDELWQTHTALLTNHEALQEKHKLLEKEQEASNERIAELQSDVHKAHEEVSRLGKELVACEANHRDLLQKQQAREQRESVDRVRFGLESEKMETEEETKQPKTRKLEERAKTPGEEAKEPEVADPESRPPVVTVRWSTGERPDFPEVLLALVRVLFPKFNPTKDEDVARALGEIVLFARTLGLVPKPESGQFPTNVNFRYDSTTLAFVTQEDTRLRVRLIGLQAVVELCSEKVYQLYASPPAQDVITTVNLLYALVKNALDGPTAAYEVVTIRVPKSAQPTDRQVSRWIEKPQNIRVVHPLKQLLDEAKETRALLGHLVENLHIDPEICDDAPKKTECLKWFMPKEKTLLEPQFTAKGHVTGALAPREAQKQIMMFQGATGGKKVKTAVGAPVFVPPATSAFEEVGYRQPTLVGEPGQYAQIRFPPQPPMLSGATRHELETFAKIAGSTTYS